MFENNTHTTEILSSSPQLTVRFSSYIGETNVLKRCIVEMYNSEFAKSMYQLI